MKTPMLILAFAASLLLSSCSGFPITSMQGQPMPCYSTWHEYPRNS